MNHLLKLAASVAVFTLTMLGKDISIQEKTIAHPETTPFGIVFTDDHGNALYLSNGLTVDVLQNSPGCGSYYTLSPDRKFVGFKLIGTDKMQTPALLNMQTRTIVPLHEPVWQCGQVSFSNDGTVAFTIGNELHVVHQSQTTVIDLATYSNLVFLSPDGLAAAYTDLDDQVWIVNLVNGARTCITKHICGYFAPQWSPDNRKLAFSTLNGIVNVFEVESGNLFTVGTGLHPQWLADSRHIVLQKNEIRDNEVVNSDIYIHTYNTPDSINISRTMDILECEPSLSPDGSTLFYVQNGMRICSIHLEARNGVFSTTLPVVTLMTIPKQSLQQTYIAPQSTTSAKIIMDIPYLHQVWDTADWFNGHWACGPTTAMMVLAYYRILPKWALWCSGGSGVPGHNTDWGVYISESYRFNGLLYSLTANDPNGRPGSGAYGFMWGSGSPHSRMALYYQQHGITSAQTKDWPSLNDALAEVNAGYPYSLCVGLTDAGHIVLPHTADAKIGTLITNDPYGNKNVPGYPNYSGKNAPYDWPGYNNGYVNLSTVYWSVSNRFTPPIAADTLVDDLQLDKGFYLNTQSPGSYSLWKDYATGYNGHVWTATSRVSTTSDTCYAIWRPNLPSDGAYEVFVYASYGTATAATYKILHMKGVTTVTLNQRDNQNKWLSLGTYNFAKGTANTVRLGDACGIAGELIAFDAMYWSLRGPLGIEDRQVANLPEKFELDQNYPNPFNNQTTFRYTLPSREHVTLKIFNALGELIETIYTGDREGGTYSTAWNPDHLSSGIYFCTMDAGSFRSTKKLILLK
jgi:hypothetical protein